jgi:hypothetical protein
LSLGIEEAGGGRLRLYTSRETVLRDMQRVGARFDRVAELEGIWIVEGHSLHLIVVWRALAERPRVSAKVFVHVVDSSGNLVSQDDSVPVAWTRPVETWRLGERLWDVHTVSLPGDDSLANLSVRIGLYDPDKGERLPAYDAGGARLADDAATAPLPTRTSFNPETTP